MAMILVPSLFCGSGWTMLLLFKQRVMMIVFLNFLPQRLEDPYEK